MEAVVVSVTRVGPTTQVSTGAPSVSSSAPVSTLTLNNNKQLVSLGGWASRNRTLLILHNFNNSFYSGSVHEYTLPASSPEYNVSLFRYMSFTPSFQRSPRTQQT